MSFSDLCESVGREINPKQEMRAHNYYMVNKWLMISIEADRTMKTEADGIRELTGIYGMWPGSLLLPIPSFVPA